MYGTRKTLLNLLALAKSATASRKTRWLTTRPCFNVQESSAVPMYYTKWPIVWFIKLVENGQLDAEKTYYAAYDIFCAAFDHRFGQVLATILGGALTCWPTMFDEDIHDTISQAMNYEMGLDRQIALNLQHGYYIMDREDGNKSPYYAALLAADMNGARVWIQQRFWSPDQFKDNNNNTADANNKLLRACEHYLTWAVIYDRYEIVRYLVDEYGANPKSLEQYDFISYFNRLRISASRYCRNREQVYMHSMMNFCNPPSKLATRYCWYCCKKRDRWE